MGKWDDIIRRLGSPAEKPLTMWPPSDEELFRLADAVKVRKPPQDMSRFDDIIQRRGLSPAGTIDEIRRLAKDIPPDSIGPGGLGQLEWDRPLRMLRRSPGYAPVYVADPVHAVASQYPEQLRGQAIDVAKRFQLPIGGGGMMFQRAIMDRGPAIVVAYPRRQELEGGWSGMATMGSSSSHPGLAEVAAGRGVSSEEFDRTLVHELRHTLEGDGQSARYVHPGWKDVSVPTKLYDEASDSIYGLPKATQRYLSLVQEEAARFADARARYANESGRLIDNADEADEVARAALAGERGLGDGFLPSERAFYRRARKDSPEIRKHQNAILQGLLSILPAAAVPQYEGDR